MNMDMHYPAVKSFSSFIQRIYVLLLDGFVHFVLTATTLELKLNNTGKSVSNFGASSATNIFLSLSIPKNEPNVVIRLWVLKQ